MYPLKPETKAADVLRELAAHYVDIQAIRFRSARSLHQRYTGMKQAYIYVESEADAILLAGIFQNTTHHPILVDAYTFVPPAKFGPWTFIGTLHARVLIKTHPLRVRN
ncbi:hypothetical protein AAVH_15626 [Aphelenchoides avenae]|nr:hypothetical protein AAVH_15626 [Aphelenchus avenae]